MAGSILSDRRTVDAVIGESPIPLPALNSDGDLPEGIHIATLDEVAAALGGANPQRQLLQQRIERIHNIASQTGHLARFVVYG